MPSSARDSYLEMEVTTATPQKRQLMLVEGAIRFIERARDHWQAGQDDQAAQCLSQAQRIIAELISALNHDVAPDLTKRVAALYVFVFRALVDASLQRDEAKLGDALRVLQPQREAWEGVCRELGNTAPQDNEAAAASHSGHEGPPKPPPVLDFAAGSDRPGEAPAGFSLEA